MEQSGSAFPPERSGGSRRGRFARRSDGSRATYVALDPLEQAVEERLDEGLRAIEEHATDLMREIAGEMWRASGADTGPEQTRILNFLSRDQAIRSLIASSDERFQSITLRTARLEDALAELAESGRAVREAMQRSMQSINDIAMSPTLQGIDAVRSQLEQVEQHIAATFAHLDERDRALTESIRQQVQEHGDLIARETSRIVDAMEGYVQGGAEAIGRLAQRIEEHAAVFSSFDEVLAERVRTSVAEEIGGLVGQVDLLYERAGIQRRTLTELHGALQRLVEARSMGLAQLVRSDSQTLRGLIETSAAHQEESFRELLDERIAELAVEERDRVGALARTMEEQVSALTLAVSAAIERNFSRVVEDVGAKLGLMTETIALRAAESADVAVASSFDRVLARLDGSIGAIESVAETTVAASAVIEERIAGHVDDRLGGLAKMIRSDNKVLAERMAAAQPPSAVDAETLRQTLRSVKELQAGLGAGITDSVDRRFQALSEQLHHETQSTAEAMVKVAEVLGGKLDRLTVRVDEGYGNDLQIVIDRMSDAIQGMSGRSPRRQDRFEID